MDPTATVRLIIEALEEGDEEAAADSMDDLADWVRGGGFKPKVTTEQWRILWKLNKNINAYVDSPRGGDRPATRGM